jgi:aspartate oxidase
MGGGGAIPKYMEYGKYLQTEHWKKRRKEFRNKTWNRCFICRNKEGLQVHHKRYNNLFKEKHTDLRLLCDDCHRKIHKYKLIDILRTMSVKRVILRDWLKNFK